MRFPLLLFLLCLVQQGWTQLQADFSSNAQKICAPSLVQLSDNSVAGGAAIVQWKWFNNGVFFSSLPNPVLYLNTAGSYDICLQIVDALGNRDTLCRSNYLAVFRGPTVSYRLSPTAGCSPMTVNFTNGTQLGDAPIQQWRWDFGDGTLDTLHASPPHVYTTVGNFDVTLVAIDTNGCRDAQLQSNAITVHPNVTASIALSSYQAQCRLPATIGFTGIGNRPNLSYSWDLGDNTVDSGRTISHTYTNPGCFSPTLTVSNAWCATTVTVPSCITVSEAPTASFTISDSIHCTVPFSVQLTNQSSNASSYTWDLGDAASSNLPSLSHTYNSISAADTLNYLPGLIPVILTASNTVGCVDRDTQYIRSSLQSINIAKLNLPCAPDTAHYTANVFNHSSYVSPVSYQWTLDNATFTRGATAAAYYPDSGFYRVALIVTDQLGCKDSSTILVGVGLTPTIDSVTTDTNYVCRITDIDFTAHGSSFVDYWSWSFSDNSSGFGSVINHNFQDTGFITGQLIASFRGCTDTTSLDTYYIYPPVADFSVLDTCNSLTVGFKDKSIGAHRWFWEFGDSTTTLDTSSLQHPNYTYPTTGTYFVKLTVYNDSTNCIDTFSSVVILAAPSADFEVPDSICTITEITPINKSNNAITFSWQASGATPYTSTLPEPKLTYTQPGIYTLTLSAFSSNDCIDALQKTIYVAGIDTNIIHTPIPVCRPALVNFIDSSQGILSPIVGWQWGNGSTRATANQVYVFPGKKGMPLQVTNDWGCTFNLVDSFPVGGLFANYTTNKDVCLGNISTFTALINSPANRNAFKPYTYIWDFGDGKRDTTTQITIQHLYTSAGSYDVCLDIIDSIGCVTTLCRSNRVIIHDPTVLFKADTFFSSCPPLEVNFSNLSDSGATWSWSFGDGSVSSLQHPSHVYSTAGFYDVILSVEAFPGCSAIDTIPQMIQIAGPTGQFTSPPNSQCAPYNIQLTATGNNAASYTWLFGNGDFQTHGGSNADTAFYTYTQAGRFVPTVVLDDGMGCQVSMEGDTIEILPSPVASFHVDSLTCGVDSVHYLLDTFSTTWDAIYWSFPQGQPSRSSQQQPQVHYSSSLNAFSQLIVVDGVCADTLTQSNWVHLKHPPKADFDIVYTDSCIPALIQFVDRSTILGQDSIQIWQWDFGNGQTTRRADTSLLYDRATSSSIQLIVIDRNHCQDTSIQNITLYAPPSVTIIPPDTICAGDSLHLRATSTAAFVWQSNYWLSDSSSTTPLTRIDSQQNYVVVATNTYGCQATDSLLIRPLPYLTATVLDSSQLCLGDSLLLQVNSNGLPVVWRSDAYLPCTNCFSPVVAPSQTSWYYVQIDSNRACLAEDSILVKVSPLPVPTILGDSSTCLGDSLLLQATGGVVYQWSSDGTVLDSNNTQIWVQPSVNTLYRLLVKDSFGCTAAATHPVQVRPDTTSPLTNFTICRGDSVVLQLNSGNNPTWQGLALSCHTCTTPIASPTDSTWYKVQYINNDNCPVKDSLQVQVIDTRFFQALPADSVCLGDSIQLDVQGVYAPISWSPATSVANPTAPKTWAFPNRNTWYHVHLVAGDCVVKDSVWVALRTITTIQATNATYCLGDSAQLLASGNASTYTWSPPTNLSNATIPNPWVKGNHAQQYQVIGVGYCNTDTAFANVSVQPLPSLNLDSVLRASVGQRLTLEANSNASSLWWSPAEELSCDNCWQTEWTVNSSKTFYVTATDDQGCSVMDSILVLLQNNCTSNSVYVPSAFSPNGDGHNDVLYAQTGSAQILLNFQIYNRWGEVVFETRDFAQGWDGRHQGKELTADVFGYVLQFKCSTSGQIILKKGNITILR